MKIKFIKEYLAVDPVTNSGIIHRLGETEEIEDCTAQWLIDNGFAEEVKESGWWKPKSDEKYYFVNGYGNVWCDTWDDLKGDHSKLSIGNVFKTEGAAERYKEYLKAVAIVRQDEGVIDLQGALERHETVDKADDFPMYTIAYNLYLKELIAVGAGDFMTANTIWFDSMEHADASLNKHPDGWKIIVNYDWSQE